MFRRDGRTYAKTIGVPTVSIRDDFTMNRRRNPTFSFYYNRKHKNADNKDETFIFLWIMDWIVTLHMHIGFLSKCYYTSGRRSFFRMPLYTQKCVSSLPFIRDSIKELQFPFIFVGFMWSTIIFYEAHHPIMWQKVWLTLHPVKVEP
jgi:hypothetical protein